jgi:hypothetical protein
MFRRLEIVRWTLDEIPFHEVDKSLVSKETLVFLRVNCLMELSSLYATRMFLRDFREMPDFCQFTSIWYYEEMKHYLVLREYLKLFDQAPDETDFTTLDTELPASPWPPTLALHYCGELRLGMWYGRWSQEMNEPVLSQIYRHISNDEFRHAGCYKEFMEHATRSKPELLIDFMQASKWMLVNPTGDKHPTTMKADRETESSVVDRIEGYEVLLERVRNSITDEDEENLCQQVLTTFSRLSERKLASLADMAALTRELQRNQRADATAKRVPPSDNPPSIPPDRCEQRVEEVQS